MARDPRQMSLLRRHLSPLTQFLTIAILALFVGVAILAWPVIGKNVADPARRAQPAPSEKAYQTDLITYRLSVRADVENSASALKPGTFANFSIITGEAATAPAVPQRAIVYESDTARVWVADDDGTIAARSIRTGRMADGMIEILAGLSQGENDMTSGALSIDRAVGND